MNIKEQMVLHKKLRSIIGLLMIIGILILCQVTTYAKSKDTQSIDGEVYQDMVEQVINLIPKGRLDPYEHDAAHKQFDINSYFTVLNHVKVCDDFDLDYCFCAIQRYGHPYIYLRKKGEPPYDLRTVCSIIEQVMFRSDDFDVITKGYMQHIHVDGTPESLIQFAILYLIGDQFFLFDHANYDDDIIIFTKSKLNEVLNSKLSFQKEFQPPDYVLKNAEEAKKNALKLDVTPIFEEDENRVSVKVIFFSKWKGFQQHTFTFLKKLNYNFEQMKKETLIPHNCGIMF